MWSMSPIYTQFYSHDGSQWHVGRADTKRKHWLPNYTGAFRPLA